MVYDPISLLSENDWAIINKIAAAPLCSTQKVQWCETCSVTKKVRSILQCIRSINTIRFFIIF